MGWIDWTIVILYLVSLVIMSIVLAKKQKSQKDYYLGGQNIKSWQVGSSFVANQVSAISLIGVPAFIALKQNGGLKWLQYELAVPLAMIIIIILLVPVFWKNKGSSIYEYLERRYGKTTRLTLSIIFLLSRSLASGVVLLSTGYVASICLGINLYLTIIIIGLIALFYTSFGGIKADIYSDILQLGTLWVSSIIIIIILINLLEGQINISSLAPERLKIFNLSQQSQFQKGSFGLFPMLIGGFFLYLSYYGCDQSQAQRLLCTGSPDKAKKALVINSFLRFPLVITYSLIGLLLLSFINKNPVFSNLVSQNDPNFLMPEFFNSFLPVGILGIVIAGIFAATMSSLDSALNSLSAATWEDFVVKILPEKTSLLSNKKKILYSRFLTLTWGILVILFAFLFSKSSDTVVELVNKIGSAFYGPIAAVFILGILSKNFTSKGILSGMFLGVFSNLYLWIFHSESISWLWWNFTGFVITAIIAGIVSAFDRKPTLSHSSKSLLIKNNQKTIFVLLLLFLFIIISLLLFEKILII